MQYRTKRNLVIAVLLAACAGLAFLATAWQPRPAIPLTAATFEQLRVGQTVPDVERQLGPPDRRIQHPVTVWIPRGTRRVSARLTADTAFRCFPNATDAASERVWLDNQGLIAVQFDAQGRLQQKYYSPVMSSRRPTLSDWIRSHIALFR